MDPALDPSSEQTPYDAFIARSSRIQAFYQRYLDISTPFVLYRWLALFGLVLFFLLRIIFAQGWYIVCYTLFIYLLNLLLSFLQPKFDPSLEQELQDASTEEGNTLPTRKDEEFRPFIRRLPEFKFWYSATRATVIAIVCSFFAFFDIPVFWPVLLVYFLVLFALTMRRQIQHMIKYRYIPFDLGKTRYTRGRDA